MCLFRLTAPCVVSGVKVSQVKKTRVQKVFTPIWRGNVFDGNMELDTHADTFVAGRNCTVLAYTERVCDVMPYSDTYDAREGVPIVQAATGYTMTNGERVILVINEALWMPDMSHSLCNPNQLRHFGVQIQDNPYSNEPMHMRKEDEDGTFVACFKSQGTCIFLETWTPTDGDLQSYPHIVISSSAP